MVFAMDRFYPFLGDEHAVAFGVGGALAFVVALVDVACYCVEHSSVVAFVDSFVETLAAFPDEEVG